MVPAGDRGKLRSTGLMDDMASLEVFHLLFLQVLIETVPEHVRVKEPFLPVELEPFGSRLTAVMTNASHDLHSLKKVS